MSLRFFFFFNDTATTEIYTLSLHDALPISGGRRAVAAPERLRRLRRARAPGRLLGSSRWRRLRRVRGGGRSEEHTSELQSRQYLVCRLLLEKKKKKQNSVTSILSSHKMTHA